MHAKRAKELSQQREHPAPSPVMAVMEQWMCAADCVADFCIA
jgi:hypothetical protein